MKTIVQLPDPVLRQTAAPVATSEIKGKHIKTLIEDMKKAVEHEEDAVAIAAPQLGESVRLFVVSKRVDKKYEDDLVFINPEIIRLGKNKTIMQEGCLSVRWKYGDVKRATTASVRALNVEGNEFVMNGRGLLAQIFQHEVDHLNGILFIDTAKNIEDIPPQK
ncbi:MAG: peptide deformylase, peptide deformylase [Candidatus Nomurabacteria bacterium]|jgi:peptide deformylase|nr:peptide deformylase, peptide deformylase [Candidatus Nomurabacteria bacterium]